MKRSRVKEKAESGELKNFLDGEYHSRGKIDVLVYRQNVAEYLPGTSVLGTKPGTVSGKPETVSVEDLTMPVGTREASVPRGYLIPATMPEVAAKLRAHNITVGTLEKPAKFDGESFTISGVRKVRRSGYDMVTLDGTFGAQQAREFPAGTFVVDMAPAHGERGVLLPRAAGTRRIRRVGGVLDAWVRGPGEYPIFKYRREAR
jgi:hypothetical protein